MSRAAEGAASNFSERVKRAAGRLGDRSFAVITALAVLAVFAPRLADVDSILYGSDTLLSFAHYRAFTFRVIRAGELPFWGPFSDSGMPFYPLASGWAYPSTYLLAWFPVHRAITIEVAFHAVLAGVGAFLLFRSQGRSLPASAVAGFVFAVAGVEILHVVGGHLPRLAARAYIPFVFLQLDAFRRSGRPRDAALAALAIGLQIATGYVQLVFYTLLTATVATLAVALRRGDVARRAAVMRVGGAIALGIATASIVLVPMALWAGEAGRDRSAAFGATGSIAWHHLVTAIAPSAFGNRLDEPYVGDGYIWTTSVYVSVSALLLAVLAVVRRPRGSAPYLAGALGCLIVAMGEHTPVHGLLRALVPGFDFFRDPGRALSVYALFLAGLAAVGLDAISEHLAAPASRRAMAALALVFAMPCVEGAWFASRYLVGVDPATVRWEPEIAAVFATDRSVYRVLDSRPASLNRGLTHGVESVNGYEGGILRRYGRYLDAAEGRDRPTYRAMVQLHGYSRMIDRLNVKYVVAPPLDAPPRGFAIRARAAHVTLLERTRVQPRAWLVHRASLADTGEQALRRLARDEVDPRVEVVLEGGAPSDRLEGGPAAPDDSVAIVARTNNTATYRIRSAGEAWLVLSDIWSPGWDASVDGRSARTLPAFGTFRAIRVPRGEHRLTTRFTPPGLRVGALLTALSVALVVAMLTRSGRAREDS